MCFRKYALLVACSMHSGPLLLRAVGSSRCVKSVRVWEFHKLDGSPMYTTCKHGWILSLRVDTLYTEFPVVAGHFRGTLIKNGLCLAGDVPRHPKAREDIHSPSIVT